MTAATPTPTEREELETLIWAAGSAILAADALLAAGYRKPAMVPDAHAIKAEFSVMCA